MFKPSLNKVFTYLLTYLLLRGKNRQIVKQMETCMNKSKFQLRVKLELFLLFTAKMYVMVTQKI